MYVLFVHGKRRILGGYTGNPLGGVVNITILRRNPTCSYLSFLPI